MSPLTLYRFMFFPFEDADSMTLAIVPAVSDVDAFKKGMALLPEGVNAVSLAEQYFRHCNAAWTADSVEEAFFTVSEIQSEEELCDHAKYWWAEHESLFGRPALPPTTLSDTITTLLTHS